MVSNQTIWSDNNSSSSSNWTLLQISKIHIFENAKKMFPDFILYFSLYLALLILIVIIGIYTYIMWHWLKPQIKISSATAIIKPENETERQHAKVLSDAVKQYANKRSIETSL